MTLEDLSKQISNLDAKLDSLETRVELGFSASQIRVEEGFSASQIHVEEGFNAAKMREEEILGVARLGLEANEILRDEMNRRFDASDKKTDAQISLLKSAIRSDVR